MRGNQKVRVKTAELLKAVQAQRVEVVKAYEREGEAYELRLAEHRVKVMKALRDAADKIDKGGAVPDFGSYDGPFRRLGNKEPPKPHLNTTKIDRVIATLSMAADDAISISADDYAEYLG